MLASCASSIGSVKPVESLKSALAKPPPELAAPCENPQALGDKDLSAGGVLSGWSRDRASLADCRDRKAGLSTFYADRDAGLAGDKAPK
jgi:hypothetical protein